MPTARKVGGDTGFQFALSSQGDAPGAIGMNVEFTQMDGRGWGNLEDAFEIWVAYAADAALKLYEGVVDTWENPPQFEKGQVIAGGSTISVRVGLAPGAIRSDTEGERLNPAEIFNILDVGSKPHVIMAREERRRTKMVKTSKGMVMLSSQSKPMLKFRTPFSPKTAPGKLSSTGGSRGDKWVSRESVEHPGTEARGYSLAISEAMQGAMDETATALVAAIILQRSTPRQAAARIRAAIKRRLGRQ